MHLSLDKVTLRPILKTDAYDIALQANNRKVADNLRNVFPHPYSLDDAHSFIDFALKDKMATRFVIVYQDILVGLIGLHFKDDVYAKNSEIGYWIGEDYWGKGIGTAAVKLITDYGFSLKDCHRIYAGVFEYNNGSMRILEKNGYRNEGILKQSIYKNGNYWDEYKYAKLKSEH